MVAHDRRLTAAFMKVVVCLFLLVVSALAEKNGDTGPSISQSEIHELLMENLFQNKFEGLMTASEADSLTGVEFVLASSTTEKKITFAQLNNFVAENSRMYPLIDAGLGAPKGLAWDRHKGYLYVADSDGKRILAYQIRADVDKDTLKKKLYVANSPMEIVSNYVVEYLYVDNKSTLYFASPDTVYSMDYATLRSLIGGEITPDMLAVKQIEEQLVADPAVSGGLEQLPDQAIWEMFKVGSLTESFSGVAANGDGVVYLGSNRAAKGTVMEGIVAPGLKKSSNAVLQHGSMVQGVALTPNLAVFATDSSSVLGVPLDGEAHTEPVVLANTLKMPRQVAFDGDGTLYVADQGNGAIYSLPAGTRKPVTPDQVSLFNGAFGVAIIRGDDPGLHVKQSRVEQSTSLFAV